MSEIAKCCPDCEPIVQVRGQMGPGDYFGLMLPNGRPDVDHYKIVDMHDGIRNDIRIACKSCFMAAPWGPKDFPGAPGAGRDYLIKRWNEMVAAKKQKEDMMAMLKEKFGEDAIAKHLAFSI